MELENKIEKKLTKVCYTTRKTCPICDSDDLRD